MDREIRDFAAEIPTNRFQENPPLFTKSSYPVTVHAISGRSHQGSINIPVSLCSNSSLV